MPNKKPVSTVYVFLYKVNSVSTVYPRIVAGPRIIAPQSIK